MENVITESLRNEISNMRKIKLKELQKTLQIQCDKEVRWIGMKNERKFYEVKCVLCNRTIRGY